MSATQTALLQRLKPWRWVLAGLGVLAMAVLVVLLEPLTQRHRELVEGDRAAAALRAKGDAVMTALKGQLKDPLEDQFGELWLADGRLVCGFVNVLDGSPSYGGWEPFVGSGPMVYRITDKSKTARTWFKACADGRIRMIYPGRPGAADMAAWVSPVGTKASD